jgi:ABC-type sugar transport system ATPase subunit
VILEMQGISKAFNGVQALQNVKLQLREGEALALVGENGAGKSTLMNILAGIHEADEGEILINGKHVKISSPLASQKMGIGIIHQELHLIPHMTIAENVFLGRESRKMGLFADRKQIVEKTQQLLQSFHLNLDPNARIHTLSIGEQQIVEIVKALSLNAKILIMDEPTAVLEERESQQLFELIRKFKARGTAIVYISHRLSELKLFCDHITILRDGQYVTTQPMPGLNEHEIANLMVGRELSELYPVKSSEFGEVILKVKQLTRAPFFNNVSFDVRKGEVIGFSGLVGAGRTELARTLFGDWQPHSGKIFWKGQKIAWRSPIDAVEAGIGFATEDRKQTGLFLDMSLKHNVTMTNPRKISKWQFIRAQSENALVEQKLKELKIKAKHITQPVKSLSGGNQQKIVIAKWLPIASSLFWMNRQEALMWVLRVKFTI